MPDEEFFQLRGIPESGVYIEQADALHDVDTNRVALCGVHIPTHPAYRARWRLRYAERPGAALHEALEELLASEYGRSDWLLAYWSKPVLFPVDARRAWVEPDLQPLPF